MLNYHCSTSAAFLIGANKTMNQGLEPKETPYVHMVLLQEC